MKLTRKNINIEKLSQSMKECATPSEFVARYPGSKLLGERRNDRGDRVISIMLPCTCHVDYIIKPSEPNLGVWYTTEHLNGIYAGGDACECHDVQPEPEGW